MQTTHATKRKMTCEACGHETEVIMQEARRPPDDHEARFRIFKGTFERATGQRSFVEASDLLGVPVERWPMYFEAADHRPGNIPFSTVSTGRSTVGTQIAAEFDRAYRESADQRFAESIRAGKSLVEAWDDVWNGGRP